MKQNLLIILTPYVIKDQSDLRRDLRAQDARAARVHGALLGVPRRARLRGRGRLPPQARPARGDQPHGASRPSRRRPSCATPRQLLGRDSRAGRGAGRAAAGARRRRRRRRAGPAPSARRRAAAGAPDAAASTTSADAARSDAVTAVRATGEMPATGAHRARARADPAARRPSSPSSSSTTRCACSARRAGASARSWCARATSPRRRCCRRSASQLGSADRAELKPEDVRRRAGDAGADQLRQAAPPAADPPRRATRVDGGDRRSARRARARRLRAQLGAEVEPVLVPSQRDPRGHQQGLRPQAGQAAAISARARTRTTMGGEARSWSTSSTSPTRRRSSAGSTRCCSTRSRSAPAISTSSRARRRSSSATASTACSYEAQARQRAVHALDHLARQDHGRPQHRREAPAAGRPHPPQDRRQGHRHARRDRARRVNGERIVIRLLDRESVLARPRRHRLRRRSPAADRRADPPAARHHPRHRPTGSGKTTTLYACLAKINTPDLNILTVEDPVEYQLDGITPDRRSTRRST